MKNIVLGGGCFWCVEAIFERLKGVIDTEVGYRAEEIQILAMKACAMVMVT